MPPYQGREHTIPDKEGLLSKHHTRKQRPILGHVVGATGVHTPIRGRLVGSLSVKPSRTGGQTLERATSPSVNSGLP